MLFYYSRSDVETVITGNEFGPCALDGAPQKPRGPYHCLNDEIDTDPLSAGSTTVPCPRVGSNLLAGLSPSLKPCWIGSVLANFDPRVIQAIYGMVHCSKITDANPPMRRSVPTSRYCKFHVLHSQEGLIAIPREGTLGIFLVS